MPEHLVYVSNIFNEKLSGLTIGQINMPVIREIELLMGPSQDILMPVLNGVTDCIEQIDKSEVFLEGAINMLNYPEFSNVERAREFLKLMVEKDLISRVLKDANSEKDKIVIKIGHENDIEEMKECSLITTTYTAGDVVIGTIGIIGPTRMEYSKVLAAINYMKSKMKEHVERLIGKDLSGK